jgi:predicted PurR-regulated permease PerM
MHNVESVLIIILAITLTVFLLIAISVLVLIAKLIKSVRHLVDKAERVAESAEEAADLLKNASGPLAMFKLIRNIIKLAGKKSDKGGH